ncbi:hypothetical protein BDQ17DRAFT_6442 [Cyathus striatus]|nr:hypothetical protein BDQ17DRAFT_6442 [Cyathus striatus]
MEEDDDNFLVGVIEFGDGRQYKIDTTPEPPPDSPTRSGSGQNVSKEDRFGEDFDRSWPRSRASPATSARDFTSAPAGHPTASPASSTNPLHSPQESSRVLFNERSNKLEPYSHRPPPASYQSKRGSFESSGSNVQLLQKSGGAGEFSRPPALGRRESGFGQGPFGDRNRSERDIARRDVPTSPRITKDGFGHAMGPTTSWGGRDRDSDRGRRSDMGPPPLPTHTMRRPSREGGRQLPPHLAQVSPNIPPRRLPSRDSNMREPPVPSGSNRHPSQSPALSHRSLAAISPLSGGQATLPPLSAPELDEVRKDLMHTAAERAKQRREQEEAEREAQKERARKKAAELEVKMKAAEEAKAKEAEETAKKQRDEEENARGRAEESIKKANQAKEQQVLAVIEDAISSVKVSKTPSIGPQRRPLPSSTQQEPSRAGLSRRPSGNVPTPASESDSWRAKASPLPPSSPALRQTTSHTTSTSLLTPQSAMEQVGTIRKGSADDLEVVDFSDMGKFVSVPEGETPLVAATPLASTKPARPVASDFFEDKKDEIEAPPSATKSDFGTWRRQVVHDVSAVPATTKDAPSTKEPTLEEKSRATIVAVEATTIVKEQDRRNTTQVVTVPPHMVHNQRTPRGQSFYKESTMSALDDAMSRIKGALDASKESHPSGTPAPAPLPAVTETAPRVSLPLSGKPTPQPPQPPQPPKDRWIPPAMRQRAHEFHDAPTEVFDVTAVEPPLTPKPAWNSFTVKFPKYSRSLELVSKRQLSSFFRLPYAPRWDILSFDPPVEGMNRRDLSVNEILFRRPSGNFKGKPKFRVFLPKARLPSVGVKINGAGAFRKPTVADGAASWRKAPSTASKPQGNASMDLPTENGLDTTSRSPPPEVLHAQSNVASLPRSADSSLSKADSIVGSVRSRSIPKMPAGSAVAVLRDSRIDVIEADSESRVNFIVNSELEDGYQQDIGSLEDKVNATVSNALSPSDISSDSKPQVNGTKPPPTDPASKRDSKHQISSLASSKADKGSNDSTDTLSTPSTHHTSPWARTSLSLPVKELGVRAPDPEHLKAVWSQTSDKASSHAVNSLEGIADDLTALPFTLQDVKSEDGGTPPPAVPTAPSRMSLHDVTRAFQQVPSSSNSTTHRAPMSPPTTNAPVARPTPTTYSYSPIPSNIRPAYPYSPMMSHSPAPVMYTHQVASSPVPNRMSAVNGHPPLYSQPVWMHMAGPTPQNPGGMMRPVPSPYPGQMVTYPGTPMYPPPQGGMPPPNPQQQSNGMGPNRGRGMPLISPVMTHAGAAMYAGSPVLMPAPVMQIMDI